MKVDSTSKKKLFKKFQNKNPDSAKFKKKNPYNAKFQKNNPNDLKFKKKNSNDTEFHNKTFNNSKFQNKSFDNTKYQNKKSDKFENRSSNFKKFHKKNTDNNCNTDDKQVLKRKLELTDNSSTKNSKPNDMKRKDWKILQLNKKLKKDAKSTTSEVKIENMTKKERKQYKLNKKGHGDRYEIGVKLKALWEELRRENCKADRKSQLLKQACEMLRGRVREFTFAHDTVRVLECILSVGTDEHRTFLFEELKDDIILLSKSKYGKFFVIKMLNYGSKPQKETIVKAFFGHIIELVRHTEAAGVVEVAFNECAKTTQRFEFLQEFYGATFKYFKDSNIHSLEELFVKSPEKKAEVIANIEEELMKILNKSVIKHSIVHHVLWQFMKNTEPSSKTDLIEALKEIVPEILHTKEGSRVAMHCVWFGNTKVRKTIVKSMKTFISKIAMEEFGHMVLLALFDSIDDTVLLTKYILKELLQNVEEISLNQHGIKVLIYLLNRRNHVYFHPDIIQILEGGDKNEISKKDPDVRSTELRLAASEAILDVVKLNIQKHYSDNKFCLFALTVLEHAEGDKQNVYRAISELAVEPLTEENKKTHIIELSGANFLLKKLISKDKYIAEKDEKEFHSTFSYIFMSVVPRLVPRSWIECNRGAFILVRLLETEIPSVVEKINSDFEGFKKVLKNKGSQGTAMLAKKLYKCMK